MTSYSPDYTGRYRAKYQAAGIVHTIELRRSIGASPSSVALLAGTVNTVFSIWAAVLPTDFAFISAEQADEGSDIFYPAPVPSAVVGLTAVEDYTPFQKITGTTFSGRALGSKSRCTLYGIFWQLTNITADENTDPYNGVVDATEDARVSTTAAALNTQAFANSGGPTTWYPRATIKPNDYWLRMVRRGIVS
jgi:hypothetical protein